MYLAAVPLIFMLSILSCRWAVMLGKLTGRMGYFLDRRHRLIALRNLEIAFPHMSSLERKDIALRCFENFGKTVFELPALRRAPVERILKRVTYEGWDHYAAASERQRGMLLLTGHIGNWELMALAHGLNGHRLHFVARPLDNKYMDRWISRLRLRGGNHIISKRGAFRGVYGALKRGGVVGLLMDQAVTGTDGVFVDFFGAKAGTSRAMAILACHFDCPVLPVYIYRQRNDKDHRIVIGPPVPVAISGDKDRDVMENTRRFQQVLEGIITRHPDQWFWIHRRWKKSPTFGKNQEGYPSR
ncbi:MAG: lysophospholipid acyltransferase family protein [Rubrivivax sp.]|nr:lysophospholipid acyltransferase family protein [Rubrivivax sp.]